MAEDDSAVDLGGAKFFNLPEVDKGPEICCAHILVKHSASKPPTSWKDKTGSQIAKRSLQDAKDKLLEALSKIESGKWSWAEACKKKSDCATAKAGGELGFFPRGKMLPAFDEVAFTLEVGEMTKEPIETESGVHIIKRLA